MFRKRVYAKTFSFTNWKSVEGGPGRLLYRPSFTTFVNRLGYTLMALMCAGTLHTLAAPSLDARPPVSVSSSATKVSDLASQSSGVLEEARQWMSPEEWTRFEAEFRELEEARARLVEIRQERLRQAKEYVQNAFWAALAVLVVAGILPPLATLWQRLAIEMSAMNMLTVRTRTLWPRTHYIPLNEFRRITVAAIERIHGRGRTRAKSLGYRWRVSLERDPSGYQDAGPWRVFSFEVHHQRLRPEPDAPLPERVTVFVSALERMTGIRADAPAATMEYRGRVRSWRGSRDIVAGSLGSFTAETVLEEPTAHSRTYSFDELPPELRRRVDAMLTKGASETRIEVTSSQSMLDGTKTIRYRDEHGVTHEYNSLEEMPPDIRALFEHMRE